MTHNKWHYKKDAANITIVQVTYIFQKIDRTIANIKERGYDYTSQYARLAMQNFSRTLMEAVFRVRVCYYPYLLVLWISSQIEICYGSCAWEEEIVTSIECFK